MIAARRAALAALLAAPGGLVVYTAFNGGGFFVGTQGWIAVGLAVVLLLRVTLAEHPFAGASLALVVAAGALALFAAWVLLSATWSDAPARALIEFNRALLYLLALVLFGTLPMTSARLRWMLQAVAVAALGVCTVALITRALPEVWPITPNVIANQRLSYPITYSNALGLLGTLAVLLCMHFTCSLREPRAVRVVAAAAMPLAAATVYLTLSRGAIAIFVPGVIAYLALARPRGVVAGLLASVPLSALAVIATYDADKLVARDPTTPAAVAQGEDVALVLAGCVVAAAALRALGLLLDARISARAERRVPRAILAGGWAAAAAVAAAAFLAAGGPDYVSRQYDVFVHRKQPLAANASDFRGRLTDPSSNGRVDNWRVGADAWERHRVRGSGAGTYQIQWNRDRPDNSIVVDAHSLYVEVAAELGAVGLALLLAAIVTLLAGAAIRIRGPDRALYAAAFAVLLTWALRAGLDWDWEMPVVTLWAFCAGGAVLATPRGRQGAQDAAAGAEAAERRGVGDPPRVVRLLVALGCIVIAITPFRLARSQDHLDVASRAYDRGDCVTAIDAALDSLEAERVRPEPRLVLTYCDLRLGRPRLALRQIEAAVERDPDNWQLRYVLGINRALLGLDPRAEVARARALNPREPIARDGVRRFAGLTRPKQWQRRAQRAPLPGI